MSKVPAAAFAILALGTGVADACQMDWPASVPHPTWTQQIDQAGLVFVGHVVRIKPNTRPHWEDARVVFRVDKKVRGKLGRYYETFQGGGSDCGIHFDVGDRVIFAGDAIWDTTVVLSDPMTPKQQEQLQHVERIAEGR